MKKIVLLVSLALIASMLFACAAPQGPSATATAAQTAAPKTSAPAAKTNAPAAEATQAPQPTPAEKVNLTGFAYVNNRVTTAASNFNDIFCYQEMERQTNIHVDWIHPPVGQEKEQCNLMIASGDLPDFMMMNHNTIGGLSKLLADGVIISLNQYLDEGKLPNYESWMDMSEQVRKQLLMDDGTLAALFCLRIREYNGQMGWFTNGGLVVRKDWMDKLNLAVPVTVDDFYQVLKAFKEQDPNGNGQSDELPLVAEKNVNFMAECFGTGTDFIDLDGQAIYGPLMPEYREFVETMAQWFQEGLIDPDFTVTDNKMLQAKFVENRAGAYNGNVGGSATLLEIMRDTTPDMNFVGVTNLKKDANALVYSSLGDLKQSFTNDCSMITTKCTNIDATLRLLDWPYGEEGFEVFNWGEEGVTYEWRDGKKYYTDEILNNPEGFPLDRALTRYAMAMCQYSMPKDPEYWVQASLRYDYQLEAIDNWGMVDKAIAMPPISRTPEEATRYAQIMSEINTLRDEVTTKIIIGTESIAALDDMIGKIKNLGIEEAITINQTALDRYNAR